jgi:hypothetical protein
MTFSFDYLFRDDTSNIGTFFATGSHEYQHFWPQVPAISRCVLKLGIVSKKLNFIEKRPTSTYSSFTKENICLGRGRNTGCWHPSL